MKKRIGLNKDTYMLRYAGGVPAAEKKQYWHHSPWAAFRLLLTEV